jgi:alkanesulfonate monooxygenase SsuD/methylene tetrahydromethanopterin reductase-like flavin-dependent oxidoreductase (luciferase family)
MAYRGTFGVQFLPHHPIWNRVTAPELLRLAETAAAGDLQVIWFSTRFLARDTMTLMAACAARVPMSLGTQVHAPWGENPLELASSLGTIAELLPEGREVLWGLGSGQSQARWVERPRPNRFMRETFGMIRHLLDGDEVQFSNYPLVSGYFHLTGSGQMSVDLTRPEAVSFWFAPQGPLGDRLAADLADGIFVESGTRLGLSALSDGRLDREIEAIETRRASGDNPRPLRKALVLEMSLSRDRAAAMQRARMHGETAARRRKAASLNWSSPTSG